VTTTSLPNGVEGLAYNRTLAAVGGDGSYSWALASGSGPLPTGLSLATNGDITGTPTVPGTQNFTVEVTSGAQTDQQALSITSDGGASAPDAEPQLVYIYDSWFRLLLYGVFTPDDPTLTDGFDCTLPDEATNTTVGADTDATLAVGGEGATEEFGTTAEPQPAEGCSWLGVEGPTGQVNHGSVISNFVDTLRIGFDGGLPFGWYVRQIAGLDLGKGDDQANGPDGDDDDLASTKPAKEPKTNNGRGHGKKSN